MKKLILVTFSLIITFFNANAQNQMVPIKNLPNVKQDVKKANSNYQKARPNQRNIRANRPVNNIANKPVKLPQIAKDVAAPASVVANVENKEVPNNNAPKQDQLNVKNNLTNKDLRQRVRKRLEMMKNLTDEQKKAVKQARKEYLEKVRQITNTAN